MATQIYGNATSTIFNVKRDKYGLTRVFTPASASTLTASGWSPTGHLPPSANLETIQEEKLIEDFQRHNLYNFTVRELVNLDVISSRILEEGNLANPIHPIFSRNVWEQVGQRPYDWHIQTPELTARGDLCIMHNPIISEAMMPVLTLASAFLSRMHAVPFFDALFLGPRRPMEQNSSTTRLPAGLCTFWRRTPGQTNANDFAECKKKFSVALRLLHKTIRWEFAPGTRMPWDVVPMKGSGCLGITHEGENADNRDTIWIFIDQKLCDLLLRGDLTSVEKAGAQYFLAIVMCHELTHALWFCIQDHKLNKHYEPFFEDAPQCELGFEMENSVFGGLIEALIPTPAAPFAYAMGCTYPNYSSLNQRVPRTIVMNNAKAYYDQSFQYFIPVQTFEDIRKQIYWDTAIRQFGFTVIHTRSIKHGWKVDFAPDWKDVDQEGRPSYKSSLFARINYLQGIPLSSDGEIRVLVSKYDVKQLTPKEKASFKCIEDLIISARQEEEFYDFTQDQEDKLWEVRETFVSFHEAQNTNVIEDRDRIAQDLIKLLDQAITNHNETFLLLHKSETLRGGEKFRDRRATLFRWNIGTRRLLNELFTLINDIPNRKGESEAIFMQLMNLLCNLEYVRLQLFPPTSTWEMYQEKTPEGIEELKKWPKDLFRQELAELEFMARLSEIADTANTATKFDSTECYKISKEILRANRGGTALSFYCRALCESLLIVATPTFKEQNWTERKAAIDSIAPWFVKMQDGCTPNWNCTFERWLEWFRMIGSRDEEEERLREEEERMEEIMEERRRRRTRY